MRKKLLAGLVLVLFVFGLTGTAGATLVTIGTATYGGNNYNLIYDADSPFGPITWLDYRTPTTAAWQSQVDWAAGLALTVTLNPGYTTSIDWTTGWRLPKTVDGEYSFAYDGTATAGYNITSSEMGHLFYTELENLGYYNTSGASQTGYGLTKPGDFENLTSSGYWSDTALALDSRYTNHAWHFGMDNGNQHFSSKGATKYGLAVHAGQVSSVPIPGALWLLGSGLFGLVAVRRRKG